MIITHMAKSTGKGIDLLIKELLKGSLPGKENSHAFNQAAASVSWGA